MELDYRAAFTLSVVKVLQLQTSNFLPATLSWWLCIEKKAKHLAGVKHRTPYLKSSYSTSLPTTPSSLFYKHILMRLNPGSLGPHPSEF